jgi:hypothetical protein
MAGVDQLVLPAWNSRATDSLFGTFTLGETADYVAVIFSAPSAQTITQLGVNISAVSGSPSLEISLQGVSNGAPDGTIKASGSAKKSWAAATGWTWQTLDSSYTTTAGEFLAWVVKLTSGTSATINCRISGTPGFPVCVTFDNAPTPTTTRAGTLPVWGAKGSSTSFCWGQPISTATTTGITNASTIESGMEFLVPSWVSSVQVSGARLLGRLTTTAASMEIGIYTGNGASDTTRAQSITLSGNEVQTTSNPVPIVVGFPPVTVNGGAGFRLSARVTSGTYNEINFGLASSEDMLAWTGFWGNGNAARTRRTTGNWTDSTTNLVMIEPIVSEITVPSGGGATILQPGRRQIWTPRATIRPASRPVIVQQSGPSTQWVPISRTLVRAARAVRTQAPAAAVPIPGGTVTNNVYIPVAQSRRLAIRERVTRRPSRPVVLATVTPGQTVYLPLVQQRVRTRERWTTRKVLSPVALTTTTPGPATFIPIRQTATKYLRPAHVVRRLPAAAVLAQQAATQTILISAPRIVR